MRGRRGGGGSLRCSSRHRARHQHLMKLPVTASLLWNRLCISRAYSDLTCTPPTGFHVAFHLPSNPVSVPANTSKGSGMRWGPSTPPPPKPSTGAHHPSSTARASKIGRCRPSTAGAVGQTSLRDEYVVSWCPVPSYESSTSAPISPQCPPTFPHFPPCPPIFPPSFPSAPPPPPAHHPIKSPLLAILGAGSPHFSKNLKFPSLSPISPHFRNFWGAQPPERQV